MIQFSAYWEYIEQLRINPRDALRMAMRSYYSGVLSLPDYLKVRNKVESQIKQKK